MYKECTKNVQRKYKEHIMARYGEILNISARIAPSQSGYNTGHQPNYTRTIMIIPNKILFPTENKDAYIINYVNFT